MPVPFVWKFLIRVASGSGQFIPDSGLTVYNAAIHNIISGDYDGDGDVDLAVSSKSATGKIMILENEGNGQFTPSDTINANHPVIAQGDWDSDGDLDLVVIYGQPGDSAKIAILKNDGYSGTPGCRDL